MSLINLATDRKNCTMVMKFITRIFQQKIVKNCTKNVCKLFWLNQMNCRLSWIFKCSFSEDHKTARVPFKYLQKEALLQPKCVVWRGDPRCSPKREVIQHIYWNLKEPVEQQFSSVSAAEWGLSHWPPLVHVLHDTVPAWNIRFDNMRKSFA